MAIISVLLFPVLPLALVAFAIAIFKSLFRDDAPRRRGSRRYKRGAWQAKRKPVSGVWHGSQRSHSTVIGKVYTDGDGKRREEKRRKRDISPRRRSPRRPPSDLPKLPLGTNIAGEAWVTDGDGIEVEGYSIRLAGLDAPEWDQLAKSQAGDWFNHGRHVKDILIREISGKQVRVSVWGYDRYDRVLGIVTYNGKDINEWLVREGHAIAVCSDRYKQAETAARNAKRGRWGHAVPSMDPRKWRHRKGNKSRPRKTARRLNPEPKAKASAATAGNARRRYDGLEDLIMERLLCTEGDTYTSEEVADLLGLDSVGAAQHAGLTAAMKNCGWRKTGKEWRYMGK